MSNQILSIILVRVLFAQSLPLGGIPVSTSGPPATFTNWVCAAGGGSTGSINMGSANLYVVSVVGNPAGTITATDTNGSSWSGVTIGGTNPITFTYAASVSGGTDNFTVSASGSAVGYCVAGFSGMYTSGVYESLYSYALSSSPTCQPGSLTPGTSGHQVFITTGRFNFGPPTMTISSPFAAPIQLNNLGGNYGNDTSYNIQAGGGANNPTWTMTGGGASFYDCAQLVFQGN